MKEEKIWNKFEKPDFKICPKRLCFFWSEKDKNKGISGSCRRTFGICFRENPENSVKDWYEPFEPFLKEEDLPWFYFIPKPDKIIKKFRKRYIEESEKLWEKEHWLK
jgi:hypothetical protein